MNLLKKYVAVCLSAFALLCVSACSDSKEDQAGTVAVEFTEAMLGGDVDKCMNYLYLDGVSEQEISTIKDMLMPTLTQVLSVLEKQYGKVDSIDVVSIKDKNANDGSKLVSIKIKFAKGKTQPQQYTVVPNKDGDYKVVLKAR